MNTSMPSTSPDLANLLAGGAQAKPDSQCKGILGGLTNARCTQADSGDASEADFAAMLDAPANTTNGASVTLGQTVGEGKPPAVDAGRSVLTGELSVVTATTSQIRNLIDGSNQSESVSRRSAVRRASPTDSEEITRSVTVGLLSESTAPDTSGNPASAVFSGCRGRRQVQPVSLGGCSLRVGCGQSPVVLDSAINQSGSADVALGEPVLPVVIQVAAVVLGTEAAPENISAQGHEGGLITTVTNTALPASGESASPVKSDRDAAINQVPPARGLRTQIILNRLTGGFSAAADGRDPAVENTATTAMVETAATEQVALAPLVSELRREVVETVAALLAPFWMSLQQVLPDLVAGKTGRQADSTVATEGDGEALNAAITIKIGSLPPMKLELPLVGAALPEVSPTISSRTTGQVAVDAKTADIPVTPRSMQRPANAGAKQGDLGLSGKIALPAGEFSAVDALLTEGLPEDFRFQLKAKIQAAWDQAAPVKIAPASEQIPVADTEASLRAATNLANGAGRLTAGAFKQISAVAAQNGLTFNFNASTAKQPDQVPQGQTPATPVEVMIKLPGFGSLTAQIVATQPETKPLEKNAGSRWVRAEKSAGDFKPAGIVGAEGKIIPEKTFLNSGGQSLKAKTGDAGTAVAISSDNMPAVFTSRRVAVDQLEFPPRITGREILPALNEALNFAPSSDAAKEATPAPVLAHRAVETILNVVDAQRQSSANASSVNLHFKFGGDDLAVRVQLRGGEVTTQFLTDSAELRSALSSEWQNLAGQGGAAGLRLLEPTILPASAGVSTGFGSASQGQNQAQHQAQHQQAQAAVTHSELRALRRNATVVAPVTEVAPRISIVSPTSHHLTALA